ncbi:MAG: GNAT family N-acetyltransferase [Desulfobulbales bacterium]|nr:GNAT family N-acetyltransferase [Desulfobulbales bacterium]
MMTIRPATLDDRAALLGLVAAQANFTEDEKKIDGEVIDDSLLGRDDYRLLIADVESGELLAFVCYGPIPMTERSFDLYWIATAPAHARRGIAPRLLAAMEEELGGSVVYVDTSSTAGYARARAFYEKNGYRIAARLQDFYKPGDDRVIYRKEL